MMPVGGQTMAVQRKVRWGILSAAAIAVHKIPAMQTGEWSYVAAIASRDLKKGLVWTDA
jgi:hypothetical protein